MEGNLASPTIFADVKPSMSVAQDEMFGPAVCVMPFDTTEEAIRIANDSAFGLSGAIHTKDVEYGAELAKQIDSGMVHVNGGTIDDEPLVAFGGEKASGVGRLNGRWALEEFTTLKWVSVLHKPRHYRSKQQRLEPSREAPESWKRRPKCARQPGNDAISQSWNFAARGGRSSPAWSNFTCRRTSSNWW